MAGWLEGCRTCPVLQVRMVRLHDEAGLQEECRDAEEAHSEGAKKACFALTAWRSEEAVGPVHKENDGHGRWHLQCHQEGEVACEAGPCGQGD